VALALVHTRAAYSECQLQKIQPGGDAVETRFVAASLPRVREAVADAMQAGGVLLFKFADQSVEGERAEERVKALGLPAGDEAVRAKLDSSSQGGAEGTVVRMETLRNGGKNGAPKHTWSAAVLEQAACLVSLLSPDDPLHRPPVPIVGGVEVQVPGSTRLEVRNRRFFFNTDVKPGHEIVFETAVPVAVDGATVIPVGSLVVASMDQLSDVKSFGRGAKGQLVFKYLVLPDGTHLPLRSEVGFQGGGKTGRVAAEETATAATSLLFGGPLMGGLDTLGRGFAVPAGATMSVQLDGDQKIRVSRAASGVADPK